MNKGKQRSESARVYQIGTLVDFLLPVFPSFGKDTLRNYLKNPTIQTSKTILTGVWQLNLC